MIHDQKSCLISIDVQVTDSRKEVFHSDRLNFSGYQNAILLNTEQFFRYEELWAKGKMNNNSNRVLPYVSGQRVWQGMSRKTLCRRLRRQSVWFYILDPAIEPICNSDLGVVIIQPTLLTGVGCESIIPLILLALFASISLGGLCGVVAQ